MLILRCFSPGPRRRDAGGGDPAVNRALRQSLWDRHFLVEELASSADHVGPRETRRSFHHNQQTGNYGVPKCAIASAKSFRNISSDPTLVKAYATGFLWDKTLREATREQSRISSPLGRLARKPIPCSASSIAICPPRRCRLKTPLRDLRPRIDRSIDSVPMDCFSSWSTSAIRLAQAEPYYSIRFAVLRAPAFSNGYLIIRPPLLHAQSHVETELVLCDFGYDIELLGNDRNR